jgi:hypothetical protein
VRIPHLVLGYVIVLLAAVVAIFLASCGPLPDPFHQKENYESQWPTATRCGLRLQEGFDLERLQRDEDIFLASPLAVPCDKLKGFTVSVNPQRAWTDEWNRYVSGLCYCEKGKVVVGSDWRALYHELVHVGECPNTEDHKGWTENGIYTELAKLGPP